MRRGNTIAIISKSNTSGKEYWELIESKITGVKITDSGKKIYYPESKFYPMNADEVDLSTDIMGKAIDRNCILVNDFFWLKSSMRYFIEKWIKLENNKIKNTCK